MGYMHVAPAALKDAVKVLARAEEREAAKNSGQPVPNHAYEKAREALDVVAA